MQELETTLSERYPRWFQGPRRSLVRGLLRHFGHWSGVDRLRGFLAEHGHLHGLPFVEAALRFLDLRYTVDQIECSRIPETGRLLIVANHPCGALDALALLDFVGRIRQDVRIVANDFLSSIDGLAPLLLRFALNSGAPVLPVRIEARNSALFYAASALFKPAGTALLPRELLRQRRQRINLRIGQAQQLAPGDDPETTLAQLRDALYRMGRRPAASRHETEPETLADAVDPALLEAELAKLRTLGNTADGKRILVGRLPPSSPLLHELGRLRELTFRTVGEGTGKRLDLDRYDAWYEQIVLWDAGARRIAGAYRVANGARTITEHGLAGFYTHTLFDYSDTMLPRIAAGLELGRSFVTPEYWGSRSIDLLWQGIGAYLRHHPELRYLFGAVSISAALPLPAREQIVGYYRHFFGSRQRLASARRPFTPMFAHDYGDNDADSAFRQLKDSLHAFECSVPMLYKQYVDLCEPDGVRFLAFGVDPDFSDSVDGLIELDLAWLKPRKRARYLGETADESAA